MGTRQLSRNMGDPAEDFKAVLKPLTIGGGIFDFSGTQADHCFTWNGDGGDKAGKNQPTKEEVQAWTKFWWDGTSDDWTSDAQFNESRNEFNESHAFTVGGNEYRIMKRVAFGDNDSQHVVLGRSKNKDWKTGCLLAHSDYTVAVGIYDEDERQKDGPLQLQMTNLMGAYKQAGY